MFGLMRNFYRYLKHRKELGVTVALLGIDNAGKSSVLACMKGEYQEFIAPTIGFTSEVIKHGHHTVKVFDLGGGANIRGIWSRYYAELHGAVFVVDASDRSKLPVARDVLHQAMENPRFANKPLLIMANKQDKVEPMSSADVASNLGLDKLKGLQFHVIVCSALMEEGKSPDARILQGLKWLISTIDSNYAALQKRIQKDSDAQKEEERIEREEKRKRVEARRRERELEREKQEKEDKEKGGMDTIIEMNTLPGNTVTVITENPPISSRSAKDVMKSESLKGFSKNAVVPLELIEKGREDTIDSGLPGHTMHGSEKTPRSSTPRSNGTPRSGWAHGSEITPRGTTPRTGTPRSSVYASTTIVVGHQTEGSVSESPSNAESNADQAIPRSKSPDSFTVQVQEQEDRHLPVSTGSPRKSSSVLPPLAAKAKLETAPSPTIQGLHPLPRLEKPAFV